MVKNTAIATQVSHLSANYRAKLTTALRRALVTEADPLTAVLQTPVVLHSQPVGLPTLIRHRNVHGITSRSRHTQSVFAVTTLIAPSLVATAIAPQPIKSSQTPHSLTPQELWLIVGRVVAQLCLSASPAETMANRGAHCTGTTMLPNTTSIVTDGATVPTPHAHTFPLLNQASLTLPSW